MHETVRNAPGSFRMLAYEDTYVSASENQSTLLSVDFNKPQKSATVTVSGDLDIVAAPELQAAFVAAEAEGCIDFTVDLREVRFLDSSGIGALVGCLKRVKPLDGTVRLIVEPKGQVLRVIKLVNLDAIFIISTGTTDVA